MDRAYLYVQGISFICQILILYLFLELPPITIIAGYFFDEKNKKNMEFLLGWYKQRKNIVNFEAHFGKCSRDIKILLVLPLCSEMSGEIDICAILHRWVTVCGCNFF